MRSAIVYPLLAVSCWLACFRSASAECCTTTVTLTYRVPGESCGAVGGTRSSDDSCTVTICGNGEPLVGTYCGKGPCNMFGCECQNGCLYGDWSKSFRRRYSEHRIEIIDEKWNSGSVSPTDVLGKIKLPDINIFG